MLDFETTPLNEVLLTWAAPDPEPGRAPVTGYEVYLEGEARPVGVTGSLSYLYQGLVPGRTYVFHVRAVNRVGRSQPAGSVTVTVIAVVILAPEPPGSLTAELTPNDGAFLRWGEPAPAPGRAPVTGYVIYRELSGGGVEELGVTDSLSYLHPALSAGERYVFTVRASSDAGLSDASPSAAIDVPPPASELAPPEPPGSLTAELTPNDEAFLRWEAPAPAPGRAPVTGYVIERELSGGGGRGTRRDRFVVVSPSRPVRGRAVRIHRARIERCRAFRCISVGGHRCSAAGVGTGSAGASRVADRRADAER